MTPRALIATEHSLLQCYRACFFHVVLQSIRSEGKSFCDYASRVRGNAWFAGLKPSFKYPPLPQAPPLFGCTSSAIENAVPRATPPPHSCSKSSLRSPPPQPPPTSASCACGAVEHALSPRATRPSPASSEPNYSLLLHPPRSAAASTAAAKARCNSKVLQSTRRNNLTSD